MSVSYSIPTYDLEQVKSSVKYGDIHTTTSCRLDAAGIGYSLSEITEVFLELTSENFYKTMPSNANDGTYQDVYHYFDGERTIYIKFLFVRDVLVLSFKESLSI